MGMITAELIRRYGDELVAEGLPDRIVEEAIRTALPSLTDDIVVDDADEEIGGADVEGVIVRFSPKIDSEEIDKAVQAYRAKVAERLSRELRYVVCAGTHADAAQWVQENGIPLHQTIVVSRDTMPLRGLVGPVAVVKLPSFFNLPVTVIQDIETSLTLTHVRHRP